MRRRRASSRIDTAQLAPMILDAKIMPPPPSGGYLPQTIHPEEEPVSRTYQYRKVMKPMLERKRRARINRCLDELKELMVTALQAEGENVSKLEKADILELTVRHLHTLKRRGQLVAKPEMSYAERFRAGFTQCATEVSQFIANATLAANAMQKQGPVDPQAGARLLQHLSSCIRRLESPQVVHPQPIAPSVVGKVTPLQPIPQRTKPGEHPHPQGLKRLHCGGDAPPSKQQCYAPPSPPTSPASSIDQTPMWRPW